MSSLTEKIIQSSEEIAKQVQILVQKEFINLTTDIQELEKENILLKSQCLESFQNEKHVLETLSQENQSLKQDLEKIKSENNQLREMFQENQKECNQTSEQNRQLKSQIDEMYQVLKNTTERQSEYINSEQNIEELKQQIKSIFVENNIEFIQQKDFADPVQNTEDEIQSEHSSFKVTTSFNQITVGKCMDMKVYGKNKIHFFRKKLNSPSWKNAVGLTGFLSSDTSTYIKVSLKKQARYVWNNWDGICLFLIGSSISPQDFDYNCTQTINQMAKYPYYGVHPFVPDIYNLKVTKKQKAQLKKSEPIYVKFDPIHKRVVFKSRAFTLESEGLILENGEQYKLAIYLQYHKQKVNVEVLLQMQKELEYLQDLGQKIKKGEF